MGKGKPKHIRISSEKVIRTHVEKGQIADPGKDVRGSRYYLEVPEVIVTKITFK